MKSTDPRRLRAKLFRGLGDASRLAVLEALRDGPRCVTEVVAATGISQPNTSAHLACLGDCGLVTRERRGKFYGIADKRVITVLDEVDGMLDEIGAHVARCARYERPVGRGLAARARRRWGRRAR